MSGITRDELNELRGLLARVTPGPWVSYVEGRDHESGSNFIRTGPPANRGEDIELVGASVADQDFIAAAREQMPRLIAEIERLQAKLHDQQKAAE